MGEVLYELNDPEDREVWSKMLMRETIPKTLSQRWSSTGMSSPIHERNELAQGAGSNIKYHLRVKGSQAGVKGDNELLGNEEGMTTHQDSFNIDQLRNAFKSGGKMSEQRVTWAVREEIADLASDWWAERLDTWFFNLVCGYTVEDDDRYSGLHGVPTAPTNHFWSNGVKDEDITAGTHIITPQMIDILVNQAKIMSPQMRPIKTDGGEYYIMVLHPNVTRELRAAAGTWYATMQNALTGGVLANNPLFSGALGMWNGVVLYESNYVTNGVHSTTGATIAGVKRCPFLGAQAVVQGYGQGYRSGQFQWAEEALDYGNKLGVAAGLITGMKKTIFNSADYGVQVLSVSGADPS